MAVRTSWLHPHHYRGKLDDVVGGVLHDYFPRPVSILDRDLSLSLIQETLDCGLEFGMKRVAAEDVLVIAQNSSVRLEIPPIRPSIRSVYRVPFAILMAACGLRFKPLDWVDRDLEPILRAARNLRTRDSGLESDEDLLRSALQAIRLRDEVFTTRRPHFLPSFLVKMVCQLVAGSRNGSTAAADLSDYDYPTARFRKDLESLAASAREQRGNHRSDGPAVTAFIDENGGRGQTFVPLVSDSVWDVCPEELLALLPALVAAGAGEVQPVDGRSAGGRVSRITRRLREIAVARDWVTYGFEQTTRVARHALLMLGARLFERGVLEQPRDVLHLHLAELQTLVRRGSVPAWETIAARRAAFQAPAGSAEEWGVTGTLQGVGASPGEYSGVARIVHRVDSGELKPGEILVCEMTSPSWLPLLMIAGGVVTDRGGVLSHAAIVAREFGIPAVTGTRTATRSMISGKGYRIDGRTGSVAVSP